MKGLEIKGISKKAKQGKYGIVFTSWNSEVVQDLLHETKKGYLHYSVTIKV